MPREQALEILREQRGTGLCPASVDALGRAAASARLGTLGDASRLASIALRSLSCVSVRLFAGLRERAGTDRLEVELPDDARVADVLAAMASTPVGALRPRECVVAVNREYADADALVHAGDEVALVPPVSGGAGPVRHVRVTGEPLDLAALAAAVRDPRAGARRACSRASRATCRSSTTRPTRRWRRPGSRRSPPRRRTATGCARSRSSTAPAPCRCPSRR